MRSLLFVPGDSRRKLDKAMASGADAILIDIEDSVAAAAKPAAREAVRAFLAETVPLPRRPRLYVRINGLTTGLADADLDGVMPGRPDGIMLPKACGGADVTHLGAKLAVREVENDITDGSTRIIAIATETARAVFALGTYAGASRRLEGLTWGGEDLSADLGAEQNRDAAGLWLEPYRIARALTLMGAAAAEVAAIDTVFVNFRDLEGLAAECEDARRDGFVAKMAIHPDQVAVINRVFTPDADAVAWAEAVVAAFAANPDAGVVGIEGEMIDRPHLLRARRVLARAGRPG